MIHWAWLIPTAVLSGTFGMLLMATLIGGADGDD